MLDYAGGIALHFCAGISALVAALVIGRRTGWPGAAAATHNPVMVLAGGALLFIGNFALTGGWTLAATDDASSAIINAQVAACTSALVWLLIEKLRTRNVTAMGAVSGLVAGLAAIAPASGLVSPGAAILVGVLAAPACYFGLRFVTETLAVDDSNHAFALHGIGGLLGALLVAIFISDAFGGVGYAEGGSMISQLVAQLIGLAGVAMWSILGTLIISYGIATAIPMRISPAEEAGEALAPPAPVAADAPRRSRNRLLHRRPEPRGGADAYSSPIRSAAMNASCGMLTEPYSRIRFLPSFCFSSSFFLRVMSPP